MLIDKEKLDEYLDGEIEYYQHEYDRGVEKKNESMSDYNSGRVGAYRRVKNYIHDITLKKSLEDEFDKCCGTCRNWSIHDVQYGCDLSYFITKYRYRESREINAKREMRAEDGRNCPDWREKAKEKKRVWTCLNCGEDIYFHDVYLHCKSDSFLCDPQELLMPRPDIAIPKPDTERLIGV